MDHLSDAFMDVFTPLNSLVKVAQDGDRTQVDVAAAIFEEHADTMLKVMHGDIQCTFSALKSKV